MWNFYLWHGNNANKLSHVCDVSVVEAEERKDGMNLKKIKSWLDRTHFVRIKRSSDLVEGGAFDELERGGVDLTQVEVDALLEHESLPRHHFFRWRLHITTPLNHEYWHQHDCVVLNLTETYRKLHSSCACKVTLKQKNTKRLLRIYM